jgi:hypothetical protein
MNNFNKLIDREKTGEILLLVLFCIYLIAGYPIPNTVAEFVREYYGKVFVIIVAGLLFLYTNPILGIIGLFVAVDLIRRSGKGSVKYQQYIPSEAKKNEQYVAFNQFPYTLEQEIVKIMAPMKNAGTSLTKPSYNPLMEELYDAMPISN